LVRPVVVAIDVALDRVAGLVEVSNSSRQMQRCLSFANQDSMNAWLSGSR
jgi:hypothetical protein